MSLMAKSGHHAKRPPRVLQQDDAWISVGHAPHMESQVLEWKPGAQARIHPTAACEYVHERERTHDRWN